MYRQIRAISMDRSSPTVRPKTAALMEGVRPSDRSVPVTRKTQPTLASCSRSCVRAGTEAFFFP